ncbi:hypothetical protein FBU59_000157 [Linderina macrospora]|uniref:Uncharacterized protein n=1 Tax=Linderina macrospora TaxID=4868 RepID=A0ACC1JHE7_9FUNG|nr:hypothetical protein FBU59_000157 [Linderina macrospora]
MSDVQPTIDTTLALAAERVTERINVDSNFPTITDLLQTTSSGEYSMPIPPEWQVVTKQRSITLPDALFEQYDLLQCRCFMGIFPEIQRAWVTVDHRLFLWNYENEDDDFYSFEDQEQIIVSVALVKPRPGVFIESIKYVLAVATPLEVFLLGVGHKADDVTQRGGSVNLYATQISVPADGVAMTSIVGTENGRIFMSGNDGALYEFRYQAEDSWLTRRSKKVNLTATPTSYFWPSFLHSEREKPALNLAIDNQRKVLYALMHDSSIKVFWLGTDGSEFVMAHHHKTIGSAAALVCPQFNEGGVGKAELQIVSIHVIPPSESRTHHLVAVTSGGSRLYFSTIPRQRWYAEISSMRPIVAQPQAFDLVHVRLVPDSRPAVTAQLPHLRAPALNVHCALYSSGTLLMANSWSEDHDSIIGAAPDCALISKRRATQPRQVMVEYSSAVRIEGRTWAMAELDGSSDNAGGINDLSTVSGIPTRTFGVLTNTGISIMEKQRPVDMFRQLLSQPAVQEAQLKAFIDAFGLADVCAMCYTILCTDNFSQAGLSAHGVNAARRMLFEFGGIPHFTEIKLLFASSDTPSAPTMSSDSSRRKIALSGRHDGLVVYLARVLQPVWNDLATVLRSDNSSTAMRLNVGIATAKLMSVQARLLRLQHFIGSNQRFVPDKINQMAEILQPEPTAAKGTATQEAAAAADASACWQAESQSLGALYDLMVHSIEAISLLCLVADFDLPQISEAMDAHKRQLLDRLTFQDLVCTPAGHEACRDLIVALINSQIKHNASISSISDVLRTRCSRIFSDQDVALYKAMELLNLAKEASEPAEARQLGSHALSLLASIDGGLPLPHLKHVFDQFVALAQPASAVDLALASAAQSDPTDSAMAFWRAHAPADDPREAVYVYRMECYKLVLANFESRPQEPLQSLLPTTTTDDTLFYFSLFDWLLEHGQTTQLYEIGGPLVEEYLAAGSSTAEKSDMLWHLYVHEGKFAAAAAVQRSLACIDIPDLTLSRRIEYLSLAISNIKIAIDARRTQPGTTVVDSQDAITNGNLPPTESDQLATMLRETEDMLEVAQVQFEIQRQLQSTNQAPTAVSHLDSQLFNVSELYADFADPLNLLEAKLLIFKTSNHDDPEQVTVIWRALLRASLDDPLRTGLMAIAAKIAALQPQLYPSACAFPVPLLVQLLAELAQERPAEYSTGYIADSLCLAGVPHATVFDAIQVAYRKLAIGKQQIGTCEMLVREVIYLVSAWISASGDREADSVGERTRGRDGIPFMAVDEAISQFIIQANVSNNKQLQNELLLAQKKVRQAF